MSMKEMIINPFPGLRPFKEDEAHLFFGREKAVSELLPRLRTSRFLTIIGTSGSGKSSLIRAGLLPLLSGGFMVQAGSNWRVVFFRPVDNPIGNLSEVLARTGILSEDDISIKFIETTLRRSSRGLIEIVKQARLPEDENLLVVVDQFEEVFRFSKLERGYRDGKPDSADFVNLLLECAGQTEVPIYVLLAMRSEFLGDCTEFRGLPEAINSSQYLIPRMTREEIRTAVAGPIAVDGGEISPPLLSRLLNDVGDNPDQLPILQHALMRTWVYWAANQKVGESLDLKHYEAIGTMDHALSQHLEEVYSELKTKTSLAICEKMFKLLTQKGEKGRSIRRLAKVSEICSVTDASEEEVINVINVFRQPGRTFLMSSTEGPLDAYSAVDISHESLMRIWNRLIRWVKEEEQSAELYLRIAKAAALHEEGKAALWRDPELMLAVKWYEQDKPTAEWAQRYYPSFDRSIRFLAASKEQQKHEIKDKEKLRKIRTITIFSIIISIATLISILFTVLALDSKRKADELKKIAVEKRIDAENQKKMAVQVQINLEKQKNKAIEEKKRADEREVDARNAKVKAERSEYLARLAKIEAEREKRKAEEKEIQMRIQRLISDMNKEEARFREYLAKAKELAVHSIAIAGTIRKELKSLLAITAYHLNSKAYENLKNDTKEKINEFDEKILENFDRKKELVDLHTEFKEKYEGLQKESKKKNEPAELFEALRDAYITSNENSTDILVPAESWALAITRDNKIIFNNKEGKLLLASLQPNSDDSKLPVLKKENIDLLENTGFYVNSFAETKDRLFCGVRVTSEDNIIYCWGKNNWERCESIVGENARILSMAVSKERNFLFYSVKNEIYRHNIKSNSNDTRKPFITLEKDTFIRVLTVIEDPRHSFLIAGDAEGNIFYSDLLSSNIEEKKKLKADFSSTAFHAIAYQPEKKLLVLGNANGELLFFPNFNYNNLNSDRKMKNQSYYMHKGIVRALAFSPGGRFLASGGLDGTIRLWNLERGKDGEMEWQSPILTIDSNLKILSIAFILDGEYIIFSDEQNLRICPTSPKIFYDKLCKRKKRELNKDEWNHYVGESLNQEDFIICSSKKGE